MIMREAFLNILISVLITGSPLQTGQLRTLTITTERTPAGIIRRGYLPIVIIVIFHVFILVVVVIVIILSILSHNLKLRYSEDKTLVIIIPQKR